MKHRQHRSFHSSFLRNNPRMSRQFPFRFFFCVGRMLARNVDFFVAVRLLYAVVVVICGVVLSVWPGVPEADELTSTGKGRSSVVQYLDLVTETPSSLIISPSRIEGWTSQVGKSTSPSGTVARIAGWISIVVCGECFDLRKKDAR
jgi:hypothetical protein